MTKTNTHLPIISLACVNPECELYGQKGQDNLKIRKVYGQDHIKYLQCRLCRQEFSERKGTALWNSKIPEEKAIAVAEHLSERCSFKSTARLVRVDLATVRRLNRRLGNHAEAYHDQKVQNVSIQTLAADERHGFAGAKNRPAWEAEVIDPKSKFVLSHVQGRRDEKLFRRLLTDARSRLTNPHHVALFTDGESAYRTLFAEMFGVPYQPSRRGQRGRWPQIQFRIPRTAAHVQVVKHRSGKRLQSVEIRTVHGSEKRIEQALTELGHRVPNTSAIERYNGTARSMRATQVRRTLSFARREDTKLALGWWTTIVYNWVRPHESLKRLLSKAQGKKSTNNGPQPWPLG